MAPPIPTVPPGQIVAGDSAHWSRAFADYPASDGWALAYSAINGTEVHAINATADGDGFAVDLASADTKAWTPGTYRLAEYLTKGSDRITLGTTVLVIAPNLAGQTAALDTSSHAERMLAAIDAWLESKAPTAGSVEINGRKIQYYAITDLLALRDRYAAIVRSEQASPGRTLGSRIVVRL